MFSLEWFQWLLIGPYKCPSVYAAPLKHGRDMTSSPRPDSAADPVPGGDPGSGLPQEGIVLLLLR